MSDKPGYLREPHLYDIPGLDYSVSSKPGKTIEPTLGDWLVICTTLVAIVVLAVWAFL